MSQSQTWRSAESQDALIHDLTKGALRELGGDEELTEIYGQSEYMEELTGKYSRERVYGNPFDDFTVFSHKNKPTPAETVQHLESADTLYEGIAKAAKTGLNELGEEIGSSLNDLDSETITLYLIGIAKVIASHIELRFGADDSVAVFFNDPRYVTTVY